MTIAVDAVVYYKVNNPFVAVCNVENASGSTRLLAQTTLRNFLGTKTLSEVLSEREEISASMQVRLKLIFLLPLFFGTTHYTKLTVSRST